MTSDSRDKFDLDFSDIHEPVFPAEIRTYDRLVARVRSRERSADYREVRVWRMSPFGIELRRDGCEDVLEKGTKIDLELIIGGQRTLFEGLIVEVIRQNENISLAGVRLSRPRVENPSENEKRRSTRWLCSEEFFPTCVAPTPGRFNEYTYFQVRDISQEGLRLVCSLRNKFLIQGARLNLTASFPTVGDVSFAVTITRLGVTSERDKDYLVVGTEYHDLSKAARSIIGQYLLQFGDADSLSELRQAGFFPRSVSNGTDFYFLKSEADYDEVLRLRLLAHRAGGTIGEGASVYDMSDRFDSNSRIIVAKFKDRLVASARIHFSPLEEKMEHEQYIEWAPGNPRRDTVLEITRVCTHPEFRSNDLLAGLLRFLAITCFQPQRPWVLISSTDAMLPFYEKIGLKPTELHYEHPVYRGRQTVLLTNAIDILRGKSVHPIYWNVIWKDVYAHLLDTGTLKSSPIDHARIKIYRMLYPVALLVARVSKRPRKAT